MLYIIFYFYLFYISETYNKNSSAACNCPKACDVVHFKSSMSYANQNENNKNQFDVPREFLNKTGKHLNQSLDIRERLDPDRRRANIEEAERTLSGLPKVPKKFDYFSLMDSFEEKTKNDFPLRWEITNFIEDLIDIDDVLQYNFIQSWNEMNMRQFTPDSYELSGVIMDSGNITDEVSWRVALSMRLQEKLIASKRALDNLYRVHDAYHNMVPLLNYTVTQNGIYDAFVFTRELFECSSEINETYTRLREHIKTFTENIDYLYHIYTSNENDVEMKHKSLNYNNEFMQAADGYDRDLRIYEKLVIRQPLEMIEDAKREIQQFVTGCSAKDMDFTANGRHIVHIYNENYKYWLEFNQTDTTGKIAAYLDDLKNERYVSKLYIAGFLASQRITKLVEDNKEYLSRSHELYRTVWLDRALYAQITCWCNYEVTHIPLLQALYAKMYDRYKIADETGRDDLEDYFGGENISAIVPRLIGGEITMEECLHFSLGSPPLYLNNISLQNLTSFKNGLTTFLQKTRLDGPFSRYFIAIDALRFQWWRGHFVSCLGNVLVNSVVIIYFCYAYTCNMLDKITTNVYLLLF